MAAVLKTVIGASQSWVQIPAPPPDWWPLINPHPPPSRWQYYLNPWWREVRVYVTNLDEHECRRRLDESTSRFLGRVVGRAMFSAAAYTLHHVTFFRNSFKPYAYIKFDASFPPQTILRVTFMSPVSVRVFFVFWYAFLVFYATVALAAAWSHLRSGEALLIALFLGGFAAMPLLMNTVGRAVSSGDPQFLTQFLLDELELREPVGLPIA